MMSEGLFGVTRIMGGRLLLLYSMTPGQITEDWKIKKPYSENANAKSYLKGAVRSMVRPASTDSTSRRSSARYPQRKTKDATPRILRRRSCSCFKAIHISHEGRGFRWDVVIPPLSQEEGPTPFDREDTAGEEDRFGVGSDLEAFQ
jgi:hypothetical protein